MAIFLYSKIFSCLYPWGSNDDASLSLCIDRTESLSGREEYGSARFGTSKEKRNFYSKNPFNDTILARDVRLTLLEKKKPQFDRNKNLIVIGGSGAGKTFRFVKPNLIQLNCSNIVVDPKDHLAEKTGKLF